MYYTTVLKFKILPGKIIIMATRSFSLENLTNAIAEVQEGEGRSMRAVAQNMAFLKALSIITYGEIPRKSVQVVQQSSHQIYRER